ncbi:MAG: ribosome-associated translation inhibitor RaiA [Anaerolineae bacterium]
MQLIITGKNFQVPDWLDAYARKKIGKLDRYLADPAETRIELTEEKTRSAQQRQVVQVTIHKNSTLMRAEERSADMSASIDAVVDKLERQIVRYKEKNTAKKRRAQAQELQAETAPLPEDGAIVRTKRFRVQPISEEDAIDQMELLGHSFFVFQNAASGQLNVIYRRDDGNYGLLEPETE